MVQQINLIERQEAKSGVTNVRLQLATLVAALVMAAAVYVGFQVRALHRDQAALAATRAQLDQWRARQVASQPDASAMAANLVREKEIQRLEDIARYLKAGETARTQGFSEELTVLSRAATAGVWLTTVKLDHAHANLVLEGRATDASRLPDYLGALRRDPFFAGFSFTAMDIHVSDADRAATLPSVSFRLSSGATQANAEAPAGGDTRPHPEGRS